MHLAEMYILSFSSILFLGLGDVVGVWYKVFTMLVAKDIFDFFFFTLRSFSLSNITSMPIVVYQHLLIAPLQLNLMLKSNQYTTRRFPFFRPIMKGKFQVENSLTQSLFDHYSLSLPTYNSAYSFIISQTKKKQKTKQNLSPFFSFSFCLFPSYIYIRGPIEPKHVVKPKLVLANQATQSYEDLKTKKRVRLGTP